MALGGDPATIATTEDGDVMVVGWCVPLLRGETVATQ